MIKVSNIFIAFQIALLLTACINNSEKVIRNFELENNQIKISKFIEIEPTKPFLAKDSANILRKEYKIALNNKLAELKQTKDSRVRAKTEAQESLASTTNKQMVKIIENRLQFIESEIAYTNTLIETYKNQPEQTFLINIQQKIDFYTSIKDSILGCTQQVTFIGKEGLLPEQKFERTFFFDFQQNKIIADIQ